MVKIRDGAPKVLASTKALEVHFKEKYDLLTSVVRKIYFSAHWYPDRPVFAE